MVNRDCQLDYIEASSCEIAAMLFCVNVWRHFQSGLAKGIYHNLQHHLIDWSPGGKKQKSNRKFPPWFSFLNATLLDRLPPPKWWSEKIRNWSKQIFPPWKFCSRILLHQIYYYLQQTTLITKYNKNCTNMNKVKNLFFYVWDHKLFSY